MSLFNVGFGLPVKICVGLSHSVVTVAAVASVLYGLLEPHPKYSNRPLADITIALTFSPPLLLGVSTGRFEDGTIALPLIMTLMPGLKAEVWLQVPAAAGFLVHSFRTCTVNTHT